MDIERLANAADPKTLAGYVAELPQAHHHSGSGDGSIETVREDEYEGHRIVIRTTYRIEVDGQPFAVPLALDNAGRVHCHSLPNYQFASAVDMVKRLIDTFPDDFAAQDAPHEPGKEPGGHHEHHDHAGHEH